MITSTVAALAPTPTLLPYPDALDVVLVHEEVTVRVNDARVEEGRAALSWNETLQELAEWQAWQVVKGTKLFSPIDDWPATKLGEYGVELRACMSDNVTTPAAVAEVAVEHWLSDPDLREMLLDNWQTVGVGFDWECLESESGGVVLVVLMAGKAELREAQWEKAARGTDGRQYPWGDEFDEDKCNTDKSGIKDTAPVGRHSPKGDSTYGVADMAGNIREWCCNLFVPYPYNATDGREVLEGTGPRVMRGGSFGSPQRFLRCAYRSQRDPFNRRRNNGCRLAVTLFSPDQAYVRPLA